MLAAGTRLGPYEVIAPIGAGGMGEVYAALDGRLGRKVALKILPPDMASDPERRARFDREARIIARLEHPHICALHDVGDGYLVMELLEGETLAQRLGRGPLPLGDVIRYGSEIADALENAHRAGIVHRDLKPSNVMLTRGGAKLLDFGIAKIDGVPETSPDAVTRDPSLTGEGTAVGTFPYMAPEQVEGREADHRTDVFALGAILYEMVAGRRAFEGDSTAAVMSAILEKETVPLSWLRSSCPPILERVILRCMEKDPEARWQSAKDVGMQLQLVGADAAARPTDWHRRPALWFATALIAVVVAIIALLAWPKRREQAAATQRAPVTATIAAPARDARTPYQLIDPPKGSAFGSVYVRPFAVSPDGRSIAAVAIFGGFPTKSALCVQKLRGNEELIIPDSTAGFWPFWSADGNNVAFYQENELRNAAISGGEPETIATVSAPGTYGSSWSRKGVILFANREGLYRVDARGGTPVRILEGTRESRFSDPAFLPDGEHYLLTRFSRRGRASVRVRRLGDPEFEEALVANASNGQWTASGHLLFVRGGALLAQPFNLSTFHVTGDPAVVAPRVGTLVSDGPTITALFSVARDAPVLALQPTTSQEVELAHIDSSWRPVTQLLGPAPMTIAAVSHDGTRVAVGVQDPAGTADIWIVDLETQTMRVLPTGPGYDGYPIWSPDDRFIAYQSDDDLYRLRIDGGRPEVLLESRFRVYPTDWSPDGRTILVTESRTPLNTDVKAFTLADRTLRPVASMTNGAERAGKFSRDGAWIAYAAPDEKDRMNVFVQRYRDGAYRTKVSAERGDFPVWTADGKGLTYFSGWRGARVDILIHEKGIDVSAPRDLFEEGPKSAPSPRTISPLPDGTFIAMRTTDISAFKELRLYEGWTALLPR